MNSPQNFSLIDGIFSAEDGKDILMHLLNHKIQFHQRKNMSAYERTCENDTHSTKRLAELHEVISNLYPLLRTAIEEGKSLRIESRVHISIIEEETHKKRVPELMEVA
ncbi:MAG: hypothetical protein IPN79_15765 [Saprospiraceae bacterium]|nr:hypothetical protein [Saprospiraceae bacterium]